MCGLCMLERPLGSERAGGGAAAGTSPTAAAVSGERAGGGGPGASYDSGVISEAL